MTHYVNRRDILKTLSSLPLAGYGASTFAQEYPDRAVTMIVPFATGGVSDIQAREMGPGLTKTLGRPFIIDNRGGASGAVGAQAVARAKPDGYTLLLSTISILATNPHLYEKLSYNALTDFTPISRLSTVENLFVVSPHLPVNNIEQLIEYSKTKPGGVSFGSAGAGGSLHLTGELLRSMSSLRYTHIPYKGSAPAETDLMGGHLDLTVTSVAAALPKIKSGMMKAIAATRAKRSVLLPDVPTVAESGVPGFVVDSWIAVHGPAGMDPAVVKKLDDAIKHVAHSPEVVTRFRELGLELFYAPSSELKTYQEAEYKRWGTLIKKMNIKLES